MRFELTCPEGYARLPSEWATDLPNASAWRRATESNRHPEGALVLKTSGGPSARTLQKWRKGRVSNPHVPKDRPASNGPPLGRNSAYLSVDRRPRLELGKTWVAATRFVHFSIRRLAGDPRFELGNGGFGVRRSPHRACPPWCAWLDSNQQSTGF